MNIGFELKNYKGVIRKLNILAAAFNESEKGKLFRYALAPVKKQMRANLSPITKTGKLFWSVNIERDRKLSRVGGDVVYRVGRRIKRGSAIGMGYHAHLIEKGHKKRDGEWEPGKFLYSKAINSTEAEVMNRAKKKASQLIHKALRGSYI